ncbi:MAG: hypothetical protein MO846_12625, partial [Candidatus Devosia symbiotica]|nr:hypothetical protein [Candidatus Devosia symbiotica]
MREIIALVRHHVGNDDMMFGIDGCLDIVTDHAAMVAPSRLRFVHRERFAVAGQSPRISLRRPRSDDSCSVRCLIRGVAGLVSVLSAS